MVDAAGEFRKNGFNDQDAATLARTAAMFQNVSDEAISAGDSASFIISQMIAFGIGDKCVSGSHCIACFTAEDAIVGIITALHHFVVIEQIPCFRLLVGGRDFINISGTVTHKHGI